MDKLQSSVRLSFAPSVSVRQSKGQKKKGKKQLNYNPKEISDQLRRTAGLRPATEVLVRAREKVANLQRCLNTGQYDDNQVRTALVHARKMVRCAQLKVRNLKEEEQQKKKDRNKNQKERQETEQSSRQKSVGRRQRLREEICTEQTKQLQKETARAVELSRRRRRNRSVERGKINEADREYESRLSNYTENHVLETSAYQLELSESARFIQELQREEQQLRREEQQDLTCGLDAADSCTGTETAADAAAVSDAGGEAADTQVSVDICV